jgi:hypothetical protein
MDEAEYWRRLEFRICAEFAGFADIQLRNFWCDGLVPDKYDLADRESHIGGLAWCGMTGQERWRFTLRLGGQAQSSEQIDWAALLPADHLTGWLTPDLQMKTLLIDPLSGHPA